MPRFLALMRSAALASASLVFTTVPSPAQEQPRQTFEVREIDLDRALQAVGRQSGREIMYPADLLKGRPAPPISGAMTADEAIRALLRGSGLDADFRPDVVLIRRGDAATGHDDSPSPAAEIVVTGTRIRNNALVHPSVIAREAAREQGFADLSTLARSVAQNFSGGQTPGVVSSDQGDSENLNGSTALNLRGLGADATLTLINGHRVAYDGANQGVDISAIPLLAMERLEIVADGSSALYGSDAVAGVANIVLRPDYDGAIVNTRVAAATRGGDVEDQAGGLAGARWDTGGFMVAADYHHATAVTAGQRAFTSSLYPSTSILPGYRQVSGVASLHQALGDGVELRVEDLYNNRATTLVQPFSSSADATTYGSIAPRTLRSFALTPDLRVALGDWQIRGFATHAISSTRSHLSVFADGAAVIRAEVLYRNSLDAAEIGGEGPVFALPGGEARLALGAGVRRTGLRGRIGGDYFGAPATQLDISDRRDVAFGYGEVSLPLIGADAGIPLVHALQLGAALRYESYNTGDRVATPKLAVRYDPTMGLSITGTWGRSFKAPTLYLANQPLSGILVPASYFDPQPPDGRPVLALGGGGIALRPERARTWTAGVSWTPWATRRITLEATLFDIAYSDRVANPITSDFRVFSSDVYGDLVRYPTAAEVDAIVRTLPSGLDNATGEPYDPATVYAIIDQRLRNISSEAVRGLDVSLRAAVPLSPRDQLLVDATVSYLESAQRRSPGQPLVQRAGTLFDPPHWRGRGAATWERSAFAIAAAVNYLGGVIDDRQPVPTRVSGFVSADLTATIRPQVTQGPLAGLEVTASITNLFDASPARIRTLYDTSTPFDSTNYPAVGRVLSLGVLKRW